MGTVAVIFSILIVCGTVVTVASLRTVKNIRQLEAADRVEDGVLEAYGKAAQQLEDTHRNAEQRIEDLCLEAEQRIEEKRIDVEPEGLDEDEQRLFRAWRSTIKELSRWDAGSDNTASLERARMIAQELMRRRRLR